MLAVAVPAIAAEADGGRPLFVVGLAEGAVWQDFAYLAAVAAASSQSGSKPAVIAVAPSGEIGREVAGKIGWIGGPGIGFLF